jgi:dTDP-4-amino-4,6-dideoxygalactose transaminase
MKNLRPMLGRYVVPDMPSADELLPYLRQIDTNRWYSNFGPLVTEFEARLQAHLSSVNDNARGGELYLTSMTTCYHALQVGLQLFHLPPAANVLVPAVTFPACPLAVRHAGGVPVLADVDRETWQLTPAAARRIAEKIPIHAVMPVAVYGVPVPAAAWDRFVEDTGIPVIIDAAAALESQTVPAKCLVAHSLHATKPFSVGEGGILIGRSRELMDKARRIANFGTRMRIATQDGTNAKMSEYHGAVGLAQLARWAGIKKRRQKVFAHYRPAIEKAKLGLFFQPHVEDTIISTLMLQTGDYFAPAVADELSTQGIASHRMYLPPLYCHPHFASLTIVNNEGEAQPGAVPFERKTAFMVNSEIMRRSVFGVPFHAFMDQGDVAFVVQALELALEKPRSKVMQA